MSSPDFSALTVSELLTGDKHELVAKAEAKIHYRLGLVDIDEKTSTIIVLLGLYFGGKQLRREWKGSQKPWSGSSDKST